MTSMFQSLYRTEDNKASETECMPSTVVLGGVFTGGHYEAYLEKPQSGMPSTEMPSESPSSAPSEAPTSS
ncbi:hypothetical protein GUJ93_ZPchr0013g33849 [Zizania palustris]|uniref:Uncharacterized protein n=1 Tax=Zizania palustris TaxID=103762 RepID=A0A8J5WYD2_ZIZPA|nr:hypothetical protein GUJ93_ZPchr0013g33849 [Zizania palustris]